MTQTITFQNSIGDDIYYIDKKGNVKRGVIKTCELRNDGNHYIINSDRISENDIKETFADVKLKLIADIDTKRDEDIEKINALAEESFETDEEKEEKEIEAKE